MKVFLDTNVLVAAFATRGLCADVLRNVLSEQELVTGTVVLTELERVLHKKLGLTQEFISEITALLRRYPVVPPPETLPKVSSLSPEDRKVLATALASGADILVTGDQDLLDVNEQFPIEITNPRGYWNRVKGRGK